MNTAAHLKKWLLGLSIAMLAAGASADPGGASALSTEKLDAWLKSYGAAWEARSADQAVALFSADATYQDAPFDPPHVGQEGIHAYWAGVTKDQRNVKFGFEVIAVSGSTGIAHWTAEFDVEPTKAHLSLNGVFVLEFGADGKCRQLREWWHLKAADAGAKAQ